MDDAERRKNIEEAMAWALWRGRPPKESKHLESSKVESGQVFVDYIYEDDKKQVALLTLSPGAKIKEHLHLFDSEIYINIKTGEKHECPQYERHSYKNKSENEYCFLISIKTKK